MKKYISTFILSCFLGNLVYSLRSLENSYGPCLMPAKPGINVPEPPMPRVSLLTIMKAPDITGAVGETYSITGTKKQIVILIDFSDNSANQSAHSSSYYDNLLFNSGNSQSLTSYYKEVSYNNLTIIGITLGWYRSSHSYSYYVDNDYGLGDDYPQNVQGLVEEAVTLANPYVDFSQYDNDGDGYVDHLFIVHAGPGAVIFGLMLGIHILRLRLMV